MRNWKEIFLFFAVETKERDVRMMLIMRRILPLRGFVQHMSMGRREAQSVLSKMVISGTDCRELPCLVHALDGHVIQVTVYLSSCKHDKIKYGVPSF